MYFCTVVSTGNWYWDSISKLYWYWDSVSIRARCCLIVYKRAGGGIMYTIQVYGKPPRRKLVYLMESYPLHFRNTGQSPGIRGVVPATRVKTIFFRPEPLQKTVLCSASPAFQWKLWRWRQKTNSFQWNFPLYHLYHLYHLSRYTTYLLYHNFPLYHLWHLFALRISEISSIKQISGAE